MRRTLFSIATASVFLVGAGAASAQTSSTTTTTTWTNDQGTVIRDNSTTKKYSSFNDPTLVPSVGMELPGTVSVYPLPDTVKIAEPEHYSYGIINDHPVVIDRTTRKVVHTWE
jgi:Protein of unknown function (DUF1236)